MRRIRCGVGVCAALGLCVPLALCFGTVLAEHKGVRLAVTVATKILPLSDRFDLDPARPEEREPQRETMFDIFGHDDIAASIDVNDSAMEAWGLSDFAGPVPTEKRTFTDREPNRPEIVHSSDDRSPVAATGVADANGPGAVVTEVSDPNKNAPERVNELIGFVVRGRMAHERLQIDDLDSLLASNGERRLPLLRILRAFRVPVREEGGVFRFVSEGVGPVEIDVPNGQIQIKDHRRAIDLVQAVSDITLKADLFVSSADIEEIFDVKLEWNTELYEYRIQLDRTLSIWTLATGSPLNMADIQYMGADLPEMLPAADRSHDALQFLQIDWQAGYEWRGSQGTDSDAHRVMLGSPRETLWGDVYDGQYKLRVSHPAVTWYEGDGVDWANGDGYAARLDWFEWVRRLPSAEITLGDSSSGLTDLVCPVVTTTGVRVNGLVGWTEGEMASDRSRMGLRQYFGRPLLFEGPAPIGATVELVLNGRTIGTQNVLPEPGSPPGMGVYRFEDIELAYGILNEVTIVITETNGNEIRVEKTVMGTPQLVPKGRTAYLGLAGSRRDRRTEDIQTVDTGEFSGYMTGGRILHGLTDRITIGLAGAGQQDYYRQYIDDPGASYGDRTYPESSQHGGFTLSCLPFDKLMLSGDLGGSEVQDSDGRGDLAARLRADYLPTQKLAFNADLLNLGTDYFDGVDPDVSDRRGGEVGMVYRWNKAWTLESGIGEVRDNLDGHKEDTLGVDYRSVGLMTTALPRSSLTAKLHNLEVSSDSDDATLLELRLRIAPVRSISIYGQIFMGEDLEIEEDNRFLSPLRLRNAPRSLGPAQYWTVSKRFNKDHRTSVSYGDTGLQETLGVAHDMRTTVKNHPLNLRGELLKTLSGGVGEDYRFRFRADYMLDPFGNNQFGAMVDLTEDDYAFYCYMSIQSLFACHRNRLIHVNESRIRTAYGAVHGRVFVDYNGNHLLDSDEPGVPDVKVSLNQLNSAVTDKRGYYILSASTNTGEARVFLDADTVPAIYTITSGVQSAKVYRDSLTEVNLSVAPLISLMGHVVAVDPNAGRRKDAAKVDPNAPDLSPTILDGVDSNDTSKQPPGRPAPLNGVRVYLSNPASGLLVADSYTGADGSYYFDDVKPGQYKLQVDPKTLPPTHFLAELERIIVVEPTREESVEIPMQDFTATVQPKKKTADPPPTDAAKP